jgi:acetyl-CoA synthetase
VRYQLTAGAATFLVVNTELPKTRRAKIMRRLLRDIAEGLVLGDTTTLADPTALAKLKVQYIDDV